MTLQDVADASGVSRATVSFVLNDTPGQTISPETTQRVRTAARELGYVPNGIARALREGSSRIVVLNVDVGMEGNYSRSFVRGLGDELEAHDHLLLVRHGHVTPEGTQQVLDTIAPRAVLTLGEWYLTGHELDDGGWQHGLAGNTALQLRHLAERGHHEIAIALHDTPALRAMSAVRMRFAREAARRMELSKPVRLSITRSPEAVARALRRFLDARPSVTAVAAYDDDIALRTLRAMRDLGLSAPGDLAVIGFDATDYGGLYSPALSTVHIDAEAHGRLGARAILGLDPTGITPAPGELIARDST